jgi:DNA-binding response OmpR family regulator
MNRRPNILVVDDTMANLKLMVAVISDAGFEARPIRDPRQALRAALLNPPDLVLLDIAMPEMDGFEVCRQFREQPALRAVPILLVSAQGEPLDKGRIRHVGADDYIGKPLNLDDLMIKVNTLLAAFRG